MLKAIAAQYICGPFRAKTLQAIALTPRACESSDQGIFTRTCLAMEEGPHRIVYSLFWGSGDMDMAVISIAGTTKELWQTYSSTFDRMSTFELIDMKRFPQ